MNTNRRQLWPLFWLLLGVILLGWPAVGQAQWPPFTFRLTPSHDPAVGRITYDILFVKQHPGRMYDVTINIPLPEGTRYVSSQAQPSTTVSFDGREVSFFTAGLDRNAIRVAAFTVEITDPEQTVFTTQPWLAWKGDAPGDFLPDEVSLDISKPELDWDRPARPWLQLEAAAFAQDGLVTYTLYPTNNGRRMWDVTIRLPLPEGAEFLLAEAPAPFEASFDGREVQFFAHEIARREAYGPLTVHLLVGPAVETAATHAWASWKNEGRAVGRTIPFQGDTRTGDLVIQPGKNQWVVADSLADAPLAGYDLTSLAVTDGAESLTLDLYTWGEIETVAAPLVFVANLNTDCAGGVEYQAVYAHQTGKATFRAMNPDTGKWNKAESIPAANPGPRFISLEIPKARFLSPADAESFCIVATAQNRDDSYRSRLPADRVPDTNDERVSRYRRPAALAAQRPPTLPGRDASAAEQAQIPPAGEPGEPDLSPTGGPGDLPPTGETAGPNIPPTGGPGGPPTGLLAVPLDDGQGAYHVQLFSVPDGQPVADIPHARQPDFRFDGQRLLVNKQGDGRENVYEYELATGTLRPVSGAAEDAWPVYDPWGNRVAYGSAALAPGVRTPERDDDGKVVKDELGDIQYTDSGRKPFLFVQCSLLPPAEEADEGCQDVAGRGMIIPAGQMGEIVASHPVWAASDELLFSGCNSWAGASACGIYAVPAGSIRRASDGFIPRPLTTESQDRPTDSHAGLVAFMSHRDGNWEAYLMNLDGSQPRNISNSPANDGLPTISPDGRWVAFVSDRGGQWAVWLTPVGGGAVTKLFDLPENPWGDGRRPWQDERLSWGGVDRAAPALLTPVPTPAYRQLYPPTPTPVPTLPLAPTAIPPAATPPAQTAPTPAPAPTLLPPDIAPSPTPEGLAGSDAAQSGLALGQPSQSFPVDGGRVDTPATLAAQPAALGAETGLLPADLSTLQQEELEALRVRLQQAIQLNPDNIPARLLLNEALLRLDQPAEAANLWLNTGYGDLYAHWQLARLSQEPAAAQTHREQVRAFAFASIDRPPQPLLSSLQAQAFVGAVADGLWSRERLLHVLAYRVRQDQGPATRILLRQMIRLQPADADLYYYLGEMYRYQGELQQAEAAYRQGLELDPDNAWLQLRLGETKEALAGDADELREALAAYERYRDLAPADLYGLKKLADGYQTLDPAAAEERRAALIDQALQQGPQTAVTQTLASGWTFRGYTTDEARLVRNEPVPLWLYWQGPAGAAGGDESAGWFELGSDAWLQLVADPLNLVVNGGFELGLLPDGSPAGFPNNIYAPVSDPSTRQLQLASRSGLTSTVALLDNTEVYSRSSFVSEFVAIDEGNLYLQSGWLSSADGRAFFGRRWEGALELEEQQRPYSYIVASVPTRAWGRYAALAEPLPGASQVQIWLLNFMATGQAAFDEVFFVPIEPPG